jgi:hypothetical protein
MKKALTIAFAMFSTTAFAQQLCSPSPSCLISQSNQDLQNTCQAYTGFQSTALIASRLDHPDQVGALILACRREHIYISSLDLADSPTPDNTWDTIMDDLTKINDHKRDHDCTEYACTDSSNAPMPDGLLILNVQVKKDGERINREFCLMVKYGDSVKCTDWDAGTQHTDIYDPESDTWTSTRQ